MPNQQVETMAAYIGRLTLKEQLIICHQVRNYEQRYAHLHPGLLPFVRTEVVLYCLFSGTVNRPISLIISKLGFKMYESPALTKLMLDPKKVRDFFGKTNSRSFRWLPTRPVVTVIPVPNSSMFHINVAPKFLAPVTLWLIDNCR